jgi:hypothetical protein
VLVHVALQILFAEFEDEDELGLCVDDIVQAEDVDVFELLEEGYLADRGGWRAFLCVEMDLLQRDDLVGGLRSALEYDVDIIIMG